MRPIHRFIVVIFAALWPCFGWAQGSKAVFTFKDLYDVVAQNHPVVKQANLLTESAKQELLMARGSFDPKIEMNYDQKDFKGTNYFNFWDTQLKVPIWWAGIDLKAGYERNLGKTLGTDILTPPQGVSYVGFSLPVGQNLLIDARRATVKQAQFFQKIAQAEQVKDINKIILSAAKDYWSWAFSYQQYRLLQDFYDLADVRFRAVRQRALIGDLAAVDTTEALVTLQDRQVQRDQAAVDLQNTRLMLSNYLWKQTGEPLELPEFAVPQSFFNQAITPQTLDNLLERARQQHPELIKIDFKQKQLDIDRLLARQMLMPKIKVDAAALTTGADGFFNDANLGQKFLRDNYKLGVDFSMPLFLRKERGKLEMVKIKQLQTDFERKLLAREILNEVNAAYNDVKNMELQLNVQQKAVSNQEILVRAETQKFEMGESSLFLVNSREAKLNELLLKAENIKAKYEKSKATLLFAAGLAEW